MGLLDQLRTLGTRLRIIQVISTQNGQPPVRVTARMVSLEELGAELRADDVRDLAELPAELSVPFDKVFEAAGVKAAPEAWTVERLCQLLGTGEFKRMDRAAAQKAILGLLAADKARPEDIVRDAVARDKALDAFEAFVRRKMAERKNARDLQAAEIDGQIRRLKEDCDRLRDEAKVDEDQFRKWCRRKISYEKDMASAVAYLVEGQIVTIDSDADGE